MVSKVRFRFRSFFILIDVIWFRYHFFLNCVILCWLLALQQSSRYPACNYYWQCFCVFSDSGSTTWPQKFVYGNIAKFYTNLLELKKVLSRGNLLVFFRINCEIISVQGNLAEILFGSQANYAVRHCTYVHCMNECIEAYGWNNVRAERKKIDRQWCILTNIILSLLIDECKLNRRKTSSLQMSKLKSILNK